MSEFDEATFVSEHTPTHGDPTHGDPIHGDPGPDETGPGDPVLNADTKPGGSQPGGSKPGTSKLAGSKRAKSVSRPAAVSTGKPITRAVVRRVLARRTEVADATGEVRDVVSRMLGCADDVDEITLVSLSGDGAVVADIAEVSSVRAMSPMEAGVHVASMKLDRLAAIWSLLVALGRVPVTRPNVPVKAALAAVEAIHGLSDSDVELMSDAAELLR